MKHILKMRFGLRASKPWKGALTFGAMGFVLAQVGCARPYGVPPFSQLVAEAPGQAASFRAPDDGTVYVDGPGRPGQARHLVYTGLVHRAETVTVDPSSRQLLIDGKTAPASIQDGNSFYQVWYKPIPEWTWP